MFGKRLRRAVRQQIVCDRGQLVGHVIAVMLVENRAQQGRSGSLCADDKNRRAHRVFSDMYPLRRSVSSPPWSSASCARPDRSATWARRQVENSRIITPTDPATHGSNLVQG